MTPEVSLIIPTMGERASLAVALRSALAQDFPRLEILVVDDAAPGATWRQVEPYATLLADPRVRIVPFGRRLGCAAAKNAGWNAARGTWLCYLDDDNAYQPTKVSAQHELALRSGAPVILCGIEFRAGGRRRLKQAAARGFRGVDQLLATLPDTNVLFHRRDLAARWDEELGTADDACLFQAILRETSLGQVPNVPQSLVIYHAHQGLRANRDAVRHYRGLRRLVVKWARGYPRQARRVLLCRALVAAEKHESGSWGRFASRARALLREGGWSEWRTVANAAGSKLPFLRRWLVS